MSNEKQDEFLEKAVADANAIQEMALDNAKKYLGNILNGKIEEELEKKLVEEDSKINKKLAEQEDEEESEEEKDVEKEKEEEKESKEEEIDINIDAVLKELKDEMDEKDEIDEDEEDEIEINLDELDESDEDENEQIFEVDLKELENELGLVTEQDEEEDEEEPEEEEDEEEDEEEMEESEVIKLKKENKKYKNVIKEMQEKLNEAIFLNTKLKYANLLTSAKALTEDQKQKIINTFDRCDTVKEVKLAFVTLVEAFDLQTSEDENTEVKSKNVKLKEGASRIEKKTEVDTNDDNEEIINEQKFMKGAKRLQKIAGIRD